jgi:hypothetical protein
MYIRKSHNKKAPDRGFFNKEREHLPIILTAQKKNPGNIVFTTCLSGVFLLGCQNNGQMLPLFIKKAPVRGFFYVPTGFSATCT